MKHRDPGRFPAGVAAHLGRFLPRLGPFACERPFLLPASPLRLQPAAPYGR